MATRRLPKSLVRLVAALAILAAVVAALVPYGPRDPVPYTDRTGKPRTLVVASRYAAVTGTPWATEAAMAVLRRGGTACDAAVAGLLAINVTHGEAASFAGVAPAMYYDARSGRVRSYIGAGTAPAAATIERFRSRGFDQVPQFHIWAQLVPASPDVIVALLSDCGRMTFAQVAHSAVRLAREGFPVHAVMYRNLDLSLLERIGFAWKLPYNVEVYLGGQWWRPLYLHDRIRFPDLASTFERLAAVEHAVLATGGTRLEALAAVRDAFYRGPIARQILEFHRREGGLFQPSDLADYRGGWEEPLVGRFGRYTIYGNGTWSQGLMEPLALAILDGIDLRALGHNTPRYIHVVTQALELAFADREAYAGDPAFVDVPLDTLLSPEYAATRRALMTPRAFGPLPPPGEIHPRLARAHSTAAGSARRSAGPARRSSLDRRLGQDTSQVVVVDSDGNALVMTPSDFPMTPMVPGTGINLGNRMTQFRLDPDHPSSLAPGKRPRITPHAVIVFRDGRFFMAYSTPGGDVQPQALVQVFLNMVVFGMDVQQAISAPRFYTQSVPSSFYPHQAKPGHLRIEADLYDDVAEALSGMGYNVEHAPKWDKDFGAVGAIVADGGRLLAGADPREETTAAGR
ncbi:MAG: gamma-glutamyltransferase family protein [Deltaproteobacteria bacterium]|nr:MAG: gamma-glutamyltransferase family protein [Deltaproteobacteria bacterium]